MSLLSSLQARSSKMIGASSNLVRVTGRRPTTLSSFRLKPLDHRSNNFGGDFPSSLQSRSLYDIGSHRRDEEKEERKRSWRSPSERCNNGTFDNSNLGESLSPWVQVQRRDLMTVSSIRTNKREEFVCAVPLSEGSSLQFYHSCHHVHSASLSSTSSSTSSSSTSSSSTSSHGSNDDDHNDDHPHHKRTWRERYKEGTASVRAQAKHLRENAQASLTEFREHPGESVKEGAKSFSGMMKAYGPVFAGVHVSLYFATIAGLFVGVDSGLLDPVYLINLLGNADTSATGVATETKNTVDVVVEWMQAHTWTQGLAPVIERNPHFASFAVAWITVKFTEPIRLPISLFLTPRLARYLGIKAKSETPSDEKNEDTTAAAKDSIETDEKSNSSTK